MKDSTAGPDIRAFLDRAADDTADAETLGRLHTRLEDAASRDGLLDVAYTVVDSPVGRLLLAATERASSAWPSPIRTTTRSSTASPPR